MYTPIQSSRLYEQIVEQIEARVLSGELKLGDQLPPERELAEQFGVSRTAVREAIKALREKGLVEVRPGRGTFATDGASRAMRHSLGRILLFSQGKDAEDLVVVRELLEPEIASLAALRADEEQLEAMRKAVEAMDAAMDSPEQFIEADLDFHLALAEGTGNALIPFLIDPVVDLLREQRTRIFNVRGGPARGQKHHKRILEAVARHDPEAARQAMRDHLKQVRKDSAASKDGG
ncbi:MAG TPA: FadR/GntR family transcriptional regulator [Anaerolineales bacterium]|nr:FadR/GntR family transcriptional regulator [Anaerolineales bacterium]